MKCIGKKESHKYKSAEPNIIQKSLKTLLPITVFTEIKLIDGGEGRGASVGDGVTTDPRVGGPLAQPCSGVRRMETSPGPHGLSLGGVAGLASCVAYFLAASARASCSMRSIQPRRAYILCLGLGMGIVLGLPFAAARLPKFATGAPVAGTRFDCFWREAVPGGVRRVACGPGRESWEACDKS